jgi:hypothetical protein
MAGPKSDAATIEARRHRLTELLADGRSVSQCFEDLVEDGFPASRTTLWRDVVELRKDWKTANVKNYDALREKQMNILLKIEQALLEDLVEPDKAKVWLAIRKDVSSLLGLDAPSRSVSLSLDMKNVEDMSTGELWMNMAEGLSSERHQRVVEFIMQMQDEQSGHQTDLALLEPKSSKRPRNESTGDRLKRICDAHPEVFIQAGEPPARTLVEGVVISPSGEPMRLGHGDGKEKC